MNLFGLIKSYQALDLVIDNLKAAEQVSNTISIFISRYAQPAWFGLSTWIFGIAFHIVVDLAIVFYFFRIVARG